MMEACDAAADRIGPRKPKKLVYWWQESAAILRRECIKSRRLWQRAKKKQFPTEKIDELGLSYKNKRRELRKKKLIHLNPKRGRNY